MKEKTIKCKYCGAEHIVSARATSYYCPKVFGGHVSIRKKKKKIIREFIVPEEQGAAAFLTGTWAEGLPLQSFVRKGTKVIATYSRE
jgi:predicted RNA-binding Zn-ribbon protein involved in translation (DUF1610 family)